MTHKQWFNNVLHLHPVHEEGAPFMQYFYFSTFLVEPAFPELIFSISCYHKTEEQKYMHS